MVVLHSDKPRGLQVTDFFQGEFCHVSLTLQRLAHTILKNAFEAIKISVRQSPQNDYDKRVKVCVVLYLRGGQNENPNRKLNQ